MKYNLLNKDRIVFISEPVNWVIKEICFELTTQINKLTGGLAGVSYSPIFLKNKVLHFASSGALIKDGKVVNFHNSNKVVVSWYHILPDDSRIAFIPELNKITKLVHTSCVSTKKKLIEYGFDKEKIILIPEGIDLNIFIKYTTAQKVILRKKLGLLGNKFIIGSFQKDGVGWGDGRQFKLEKGPDIFCTAVAELNKKLPVHVLLTGPARGYVKENLRKAGISYTHHYLQDYREIVNYYNVLDLYLIASRVEGGPKALLESWACGVPLVSTKVGMCADIIEDGKNGFLAEVGDVGSLVASATAVLQDAKLRDSLAASGLVCVKDYGWQIIAQKYFDLIYKKLL